MGKSINPMWCSFNVPGEAIAGSAPGPIVWMSLQPAIPWRVALLHCPPPLHRLVSVYHSPAETVNHHLARAGEFSTGIMRNFQPVLTYRRVWTGSEVPTTPMTVSDDGRFLAFAENGNPVIRDLSTGQTRQVTRLPQGTRAHRAVLSPDSKRLAYGIRGDAKGLPLAS